jgi:hypothetical protein
MDLNVPLCFIACLTLATKMKTVHRLTHIPWQLATSGRWWMGMGTYDHGGNIIASTVGVHLTTSGR